MRGKADIGIFGRFMRHGNGALGDLGDRLGPYVGRGDHRLALSDHDAQAKICAFGALGLFQLALANIERDRAALQGDHIGAVCASFERGGESGLGESFKRVFHETVVRHKQGAFKSRLRFSGCEGGEPEIIDGIELCGRERCFAFPVAA